MRSRSLGPRISSARPADQTAQVSTRPSRRRRARVSRRLAPRGLVRTLASFRRDISSCTSGAPSNSRGNCAPAAVDDASGSASSLRPKPCRPAPTPRRAGVPRARPRAGHARPGRLSDQPAAPRRHQHARQLLRRRWYVPHAGAWPRRLRVVQVTVQSDPNGVGGRRRASRCAAITRTRIPTPSRSQENLAGC